MGKKLLKLLVVALACVMLLTACTNTKWSVDGGPNANDAVESNGGFMVKKGDFYFFINGVESESSENKFGTPIKSSIVRVDKDFKNPVVVVPKLNITNIKAAGIYIFDDYIYYSSPNTAKNKEGVVLSANRVFYRCKLDGSETQTLATLASNSTEFRFVKSGTSVYLVYALDSNIYSLEVGSKEPKTLAEKTTSVIFSTEDNHEYVYFTKNVVKSGQEDKEEDEKENEKFNEVRKIKVSGGESELVLNGNNMPAPFLAAQPYSVTLQSHKDGFLFVTVSNIATVNGNEGYFVYADSKMTKIDSSVRTDSTYYKKADGTIGRLINGTLNNGVTEQGLLLNDFGSNEITVVSLEKADEIVRIVGNTLYFNKTIDSKTYLCKIDLVKDSERKIITQDTINSAFYNFEIFGDKIFYAVQTKYYKAQEIPKTATKEEIKVIEKANKIAEINNRYEVSYIMYSLLNENNKELISNFIGIKSSFDLDAKKQELEDVEEEYK